MIFLNLKNSAWHFFEFQKILFLEAAVSSFLRKFFKKIVLKNDFLESKKRRRNIKNSGGTLRAIPPG
uniref:Uncharacterized protein n=1 Tax=Rhizoctonia solani TaxID=456999 RepID=N0A5D5_9AGAM|nr:hypothetical protein RSOL_m01540 [Rhizoctonia solani]AGK45463.1 hypothetical protein RSOL_m01540 [Rhizoctonia solani]